MKKAENTVNEKQLIRRVTWAGVMVNLLLSVVKFFFGFFGHSQAVIADGLHSLSDLATDAAVLLGLKAWSAPADENHPYGHQRIETLVTLFIGLFLGAAGAGMAWRSLFSIRSPEIVQAGWIALTAPVLSIAAKETIFRWTLRIGKDTRSPAVTANAWHHRTDALSSWPALAAVTLSAIHPEWAFVDQAGALIVSLFIFKVAVEITWPAIKELSSQGASEAQRAEIKAIAASIDGVYEVHAVRAEKRGPTLQVDLHIWVPGELSVRQGHDIAEQVKEKLLREKTEITDVVVHTEPVDEEGKSQTVLFEKRKNG